MAFQTSVRDRGVVERHAGHVRRARVGVRPEKVTTASLASTSAPAFSAAAWTIALSFFVVGAGGDPARGVGA